MEQFYVVGYGWQLKETFGSVRAATEAMGKSRVFARGWVVDGSGEPAMTMAPQLAEHIFKMRRLARRRGCILGRCGKACGRPGPC